MRPSHKDIEQAKDYIRKRLEAEISMEHYLDFVLMKAVRKIVDLSYKRTIPPSLFSFNFDPFMSAEIDNVIKELLFDIEDYDYKMATSTDKMDEESLLAYINREIDGITYHQRTSNYVTRFKLELQDFVTAGLIAGLGQSELVQEIKTHFKKPYSSSLIVDRPHFGQSSYVRLLVLTRHTIADAWMHADMESARQRGAVGFYSYRGSSYPCQLCDDMASVFHTFADPYPPYHPRCVCYAVPVYNK